MNLSHMSSEVLLGQGRKDTAARTIVEFHLAVQLAEMEQHARHGGVRLGADETFAGVRGVTERVLPQVPLPHVPSVTMCAFKRAPTRWVSFIL